MQPAGCPAAGRPWGDDNRIHANPEPQGSFPRRPLIIGSRAPASRTPPAPPPAAGLRPVLDPAQPARTNTGHLRGERQSHGAISACPANTSGPAKPQAGTPLDTGPLLQG